jgi:uncharacterized protein YjbI with pentapeptide repeats
MNAEIWSRLVDGKPLDGLGLGLRNGRLDLSSLIAPEPTIDMKIHTALIDVVKLDGLMSFKNATFQSLDFTGSQLNHLRFINCTLDNCVFNNCSCQDWRLWATTVTNTCFQSANLRDALLGGVENGKRNSFQNVDFSKTDLRGSCYTASEFTNCVFKNTRLDRVDFQTSTFADCTFEGELREVLFYRRGFKAEAFPENKMTNVDFRHAKLRWVEFRGLDLESVRFPEDNDHIIVNDYAKTLDRLVQTFKDKTDLNSRKLAGIFMMDQKWAGAKQQRGVWNKNDLLEIGGEDGLRKVLEIVGSDHV